jgi:acyl-coenzyme A synthetase/AMP-(fatty) acid ligase
VVTNDHGFLLDGHLYVLGRADDVVVVRGRNLRASDLEGAVERVDAVRPGSSVVVRSERGYAVVVEGGGSDRSTRAACVEAVRRALVSQCGVQPHRVLVLERGAVPKTSSGKKRRHEVAADLEAGRLAPLHDHTFAGA